MLGRTHHCGKFALEVGTAQGMKPPGPRNSKTEAQLFDARWRWFYTCDTGMAGPASYRVHITPELRQQKRTAALCCAPLFKSSKEKEGTMQIPCRVVRKEGRGYLSRCSKDKTTLAAAIKPRGQKEAGICPMSNKNLWLVQCHQLFGDR